MKYIKNMQEEERCGYIVSAQSKVMWDIQIQMALAILDICNKNNLKIWAISGTMLGAVRHKGFIPWDDDIDFMMFREDYDKLVNIAPKELQNPYHFQSAYNEPGYYRGHAQVRYNGTTMILEGEKDYGFNFHQGIFIDIFVADGFPENEQDRNKLIKDREDILRYLWNRKYWRMKYSSLSNLLDFYRLKKKLGEKAQWNDIKLYSYLENLHRAYPIKDYKYNCCILFGYLPRWVRPTDMFEETIFVPFENTYFPIPAKYDELLKIEYGDYKKFVRGGSCHSSIIIDTKKSYTEYLSKLRKNSFQVTYYFIYSFVYAVLQKLKRIIRKHP